MLYDSSVLGLAQCGLAGLELTEEVLHRARERVVIEAIDDVLALSLIDHQIGFLEDGQVPGDGGLGQLELADDFTGTFHPDVSAELGRAFVEFCNHGGDTSCSASSKSFS